MRFNLHLITRGLLCIVLLAGTPLVRIAVGADAPQRHVVVIVCDGLRPDSVTQQDMPALFELARQGTTFAHHHPVYLSSTEVNGTALATGAYPRHSGIMANSEYRPNIELLKPIGTEELEAVRKADAQTGDHYLHMPTVAEIVRAGFRTVVAGTKPVALLLDRAERKIADESRDPVVLFQGSGLKPGSDTGRGEAGLVIPKVADPTKAANKSQDAWTTRVLIDRLWAGHIPAFTTLWFSEPDFAQHGSGPGSEVARAALRSDDDNIAAVVQAIEAAGARESTDLLVVSDHGFSTIERTIDVADVLSAAGFAASVKFSEAPKPGQILVVPNGGSFSLYVVGHDRDVVLRLVRFLQQSDFAGAIFSRRGVEGTFPLERAGVMTGEAPDVLVSMRWNDASSGTGMAGMIASTTLKYAPKQGNHASLSRFDMHNTLIASGPDFRQRFVDELPSGNTDVAPTVLHILGVGQEAAMDGRVLSEALASATDASPASQTETFETSFDDSKTHWRQYLRVSRVNSTVYYDEGNVGAPPARGDSAAHPAITRLQTAEVAYAKGIVAASPERRDWVAHPAITRLQTTEDVYAIGDIHGDYEAMAGVLAAARLIDSASGAPNAIRWRGGKAVLVCTGDILDKYSHALDVIAAFRNLQAQAAKAGGRVIVTMGNHEAEFLAGGGTTKRKSATDGASFLFELKAAGLDADTVCAGADRDGVGAFLRQLPIAAEVNDFFFCHAGNTHGEPLSQLERDLMTQIDAKGFGAAILSDPDSMLEARMHPTQWWDNADGAPATVQGEAGLRAGIRALGAKHLVFGHQPGKVEFADGTSRKKDEMFTKFDGLVFMIDVGMSRGADSGKAAVLRIHREGETVTVSAIDADGKVRPVWSGAK